MTTAPAKPSQPVHRVTDHSLFRSLIRGKTRIGIAWIFAAVLVFEARVFPTWPGILMSFLGATLRFWASGYLAKDSRPAIGGPYAFVRNPLYLGTYLMAVGTAISVEAWGLTAALSITFAVLYHFIILDEEIKLRQIFGAPYETYCRVVPRFFPRLFPPFWPASAAQLAQVNPEPLVRRYSRELAVKNKAWEPHLTFVALYILIFAIAWLRMRTN